MNRREFSNTLVSAGVCSAAAPAINSGRFFLFGGSAPCYSRRAVDLVEDSVVIDMLGLLTLDWKKQAAWQTDPDSLSDSDLAKIRSSGITVFHPAVQLNSPDPHQASIRWFEDWNRFFGRHSEHFLRIDGAASIGQAKKEGRTGILLGNQNSDHFRAVEDVVCFSGLGQRLSQLTYNNRNRLGSGCAEQRDKGLSPFGAAVVAEMNRTAMAVDVSHAGDRTTLDTFEASAKPVLITHSNCRALVPRQPRCKSDEAIRRMAKTGGVMGITGIRVFVRACEPATLEHVLDHFDHVARIAGVEHVGIGSDNDLDGRDLQPNSRLKLDVAGLNHPRRIYDLAEGLIRRRYSDGDIRLILGGNFQRALSEIWLPQVQS